jgi:hypothetical protein
MLGLEIWVIQRGITGLADDPNGRRPVLIPAEPMIDL